MVTKSSMLKLLEQTDIPINKGRTNILKKGQKHSKSMVLGRVRQLYSSCDGKVCKVPSRHNAKHKVLLAAAKSVLNQHDPRYGFDIYSCGIDVELVALRSYRSPRWRYTRSPWREHDRLTCSTGTA